MPTKKGRPWSRPQTRAEAVENWIREVKSLGLRAVRETTDAGNIDIYFEKLRNEGAKPDAAAGSGAANGY